MSYTRFVFACGGTALALGIGCSGTPPPVAPPSGQAAPPAAPPVAAVVEGVFVNSFPTNQAIMGDAKKEDVVGLVEPSSATATAAVGAQKSAPRVTCTDDQSNTGPECEVELRLSTWDDHVCSEYVCIKYQGRPIVIPQRIALKTETDYKAKREKYCDDAFDTNGRKEAGLCVWNREFRDNYPISFRIRSADKQQLAKHLALVRIIRNGRTMFTWTAKSEPTDATELVISGYAIRADEFFKAPVDLGLYILSSGADEATAAAASTAAPPINDWHATLATAARAALDEVTPAPMKQTMTCVHKKLGYLSELARSLDTRATEAERTASYAAAQKAADTIASEDKEIEKDNQTLSEAKPLDVTVAKEGAPEPGNAPATLGGVTLTQGNVVAFLSLDGRKVTLRSYVEKRPWADVDAKVFEGHKLGNRNIFKIAVGPRSNEILAADATVGTALTAVETLGPKQLCGAVDADLMDAHKAYSAALREAIDGVGTRRIGDLEKKAADLGKKLGVSLSDLRKFVDDAIAALPADQRKTVEGNVAWLRTVDQSFAAALGTARAISEHGPAIAASIKTTLHDPAAQLRAYDAFAASLPTDQSIFADPIHNPEAGPGETRLPMTFRRPTQGYTLLAWNAVPVPLSSKSRVEVELRLENLIPVIDIGGYYFQTGWDPVPLASVGIGVIGTRETIQPPEGESYASDFVFGPQLNAAVNGFRVGVSYLYRDASMDGCHEDCYFRDRRNFRVLIGADLIRLFTGKDTAASSSGSSVQGTAEK